MNGLELSRKYYEGIVAPALEERFPRAFRRCAVGLLAKGSDARGWDDELSRDHDWGPRLDVLLSNSDFREFGESLRSFASQLPKEVDGVRYRLGLLSPNPLTDGTEEEPRNIAVFSIAEWLRLHLGLDHVPETEEEWLHVNEASLFDMTTGRVFRNTLDEYSRIVSELSGYYPQPVWRKRISIECRVCSAVDTSSHIIGQLAKAWKRGNVILCHRLMGDVSESIMRLTFLLSREYAPYSKWLWRAFRSLGGVASEIELRFADMLNAEDWQVRESKLSDCIQLLKRWMVDDHIVALPPQEHIHRFYSALRG